MFERYTEKARRVIFFARYEASQYGSPYIETEHLLLGLIREDRILVNRFLGGGYSAAQIRAEIERHVTPHERISTSVEVPLTDECKKILNFAPEEAERLAHRHVGTEHLLLGMLRIEASLAAQILTARGLTLAAIREQLAKDTSPEELASAAQFRGVVTRVKSSEKAKTTLEGFLAGLKCQKSEELEDFFAENAQFVDVFGKRWNRGEIGKNFETLFAPYAKKNAAYTIEDTVVETNEMFVAIVLWKNAILASMERVWMHRMSIILVAVPTITQGDDWAIALIQVTAIKPS